MALRPITEEELNNIRGNSPETSVPTSTGAYHPSFSSLRVEDPSNVKRVTPTNNLSTKKTFGEKVSSGIQKVFPGQKVGQAIGTLGGYLMTPKAQRENYDLSAPSTGEVLADVAQGALTIGTGGVAKPTTAISKVAGLGSKGLAKATIPTAKTFGKRTLQNTAIGAGFGATGAMAEGKDTKDVVKSTLAGAGAGLALGLVGEGVGAVGKLKPKPEDIMNRVARLTPSDARKFEQLAGKSHGQYLKETGNFGTPEQIIEKEATKFTTSLKDVDDALETLPGQFKARPLETALDELVQREIRVSSPGAPSRDLARSMALQDKYKSTGLTMQEINEAKRLYERNVKLEFNKLTSPEGVARATNIDRALREWQIDQAKKLGFKNLDVLNKQTQLSKFIVDKLGGQLTGKSGNEAINLTDWIVLSNGDPTAVSAFLTKRLVSNKGVQARVAKALTKEIPKGQVKAEFGGKTGLPALIPGRDYSLPKPNNPKYKTINLPKSVRETNLGLDEIRNATRSKQAGRLSTKKVSEISSRKSIPQTKTRSNDISATLTKEAKKYKSAEEFVKAKQKDMVYHGSSEPLQSFDNRGAFFADDMNNAEGYGENVYEGFLDLKNPLVIDAKGRHYADLKTPYGKTTQEIVANVDSKKYDGVIFKNINDSFADDVEGFGSDTISYPFNAKKSFINESQLEQIWKQANKKLPSKPPKLQ